MHMWFYMELSKTGDVPVFTAVLKKWGVIDQGSELG